MQNDQRLLHQRDERSPVHVADWFPTLAGLAGYKPNTDLKWDGSDRWPVLMDRYVTFLDSLARLPSS